MALISKGFLNGELLPHFGDHAQDFAAKTEKEYEELADQFLSKPYDATTMFECLRSKGDRVRFDNATQEYGVIGKDGFIRTYYKPIRCVTIPPNKPRIKCHRMPTNLDYAKATCLRH